MLSNFSKLRVGIIQKKMMDLFNISVVTTYVPEITHVVYEDENFSIKKLESWCSHNDPFKFKLVEYEWVGTYMRTKEKPCEKDYLYIEQPTEEVTTNNKRKFNDGTISVTEWVHKLFNGDEPKRISIGAARAGSYLHYNIEQFYKGKFPDVSSKEYLQFIEFYRDHTYLRMHHVEWKLTDHESKLCGTLDILFRNSKDEFVLIDWKRSHNIYDNICNENSIFAQDPLLSHLHNCVFNQYKLQLNLYRYLLLKTENIIVKEMFVVVFHPSLNTYIKIPIDNMHEINNLIDARKEMLMHEGGDWLTNSSF